MNRRDVWWQHLSPGARANLAWLILLAIALVSFAKGAYIGVGLACLLACLITPSDPEP